MPLPTTTNYPTRHMTTLLARLRELDQLMAEIELMNAWRELCEETGCWRESQGYTLSGDEKYLSLKPNDYAAEIANVVSAQINDTPVAFWSGDRTFEGPRRRWMYVDAADPSFVQFGEFLSGQFNILLALRPALDNPAITNAYIPKTHQSQYFEAILDGALARLFMHSDKPYGDQGAGSYHARRFRAHMTRVKRVVRGGNVFGAAAPWVFWNAGIRRRRKLF